MNINIYGSTGIIGSKTLKILNKYFPKIKINLLCANNNINKLVKQSNLYIPKYVYINNKKKINYLKKNINSKIKILDKNELYSYLKTSKSDYSLLAISGIQSLRYLEPILNNTNILGLVNKEAIVSAGHTKLFRSKLVNKQIYPLDSEHFSIFQAISLGNININNLNKLTLTASGGPFIGKSFFSLKNIKFNEAIKHPKWHMGYKNSIDSATLVNKCLELVEASYLFDIAFEKLDISIHTESIIHSILEYKNYIYKMMAFKNDMFIPIYHFLNQKFDNILYEPKLRLDKNLVLNFSEVKNNEFPIYKFFNKLDKSKPQNIIKFNYANEFAVNLFKQNYINYTDIYNIIVKISSLNLNYKLNNINDILLYHDELENRVDENKSKYISV